MDCNHSDRSRHMHASDGIVPKGAARPMTKTISDDEYLLWCTAWPGSHMDIDVEWPEYPDDPDRCTWLEYEMNNLSAAEIIAHGEWDDTAWMLKCGIAPGQPFLVHFHSFFSRFVNTSDAREWDEGWEADVICVEPWSPERVLEAWSKWLEEGCQEFPDQSDSFDSVHR